MPQLNEVSYGAEYEEGLEGPTSPRVIEKLRRAKVFYGDVLAEFCLTVQSPVIDHRVPLTHIIRLRFYRLRSYGDRRRRLR